MLITSIQNEKVKYWLKLKEKKYRDREDKFLIEGDHLITEAINNEKLEELIILENVEYETTLPITYVTKDIMKNLTSQVTPPQMIGVSKKLSSKEYGNKILILDNIQDPGNLGTMIRSANAFHFDTIILGNDCVDLYNEKVIRSTEGMLYHLNIVRKDLKEELKKVKETHTIFGTNVLNGKKPKEIKWPSKIAIIIGNEGNGMKKELEQFVSSNIYIPMCKTCESLNAAVSASILMYEASHE